MNKFFHNSIEYLGIYLQLIDLPKTFFSLNCHEQLFPEKGGGALCSTEKLCVGYRLWALSIFAKKYIEIY